MQHNYTPEDIHRLLQAEADTARDVKLARAQTYLSAGESSTKSWQVAALATSTLQAEADDAHVKVEAMRLILSSTDPQEQWWEPAPGHPYPTD